MLKRGRHISILLLIAGFSVCRTIEPANGQGRRDSVDRTRATRKRPETRLAVNVDTLSRYVYRGYAYSEGLVHQIDLSTAYGAFAFDCFANYDPGVGQVNEVIADPGLILDTDDVTVYLGYLFTYQNFEDQYFESQTETTQEVYVGITLPWDLVSPTAFVYYDFDEGNGIYSELSAEKTLQWQTTEMHIMGLLAYNHRYFLDESGWSHAELSASAAKSLSDELAIEVSARFSNPFSTGEAFGEIPFLDGGMALEGQITDSTSLRVALNHAVPLDDAYPDETWLQATLMWSY